MRETLNPHPYQREGLRWLIQKTIVEDCQGAALFWDPGLGKTSVALLWHQALANFRNCRKTLIIAPLRVIYSVWPQECQRWEQFEGLKCSIVHGTPKQRLQALEADADIYLINPDGVNWLQKQLEGCELPFDTLIVDESSQFKSWTSKRTKSLRKLIPQFKRRLILTGTPCPNSLLDLFSQMFIVDRGESLGATITKYKTRYFDRGGYLGRAWLPKQGSKEAIELKIKDHVLRADELDHLSLPEKVVHDVWVDMSPEMLKSYKRFEREMFMELERSEVTPMNAGAKYLACRQFANGGIYDSEKIAQFLHNDKIEAIKEIVNELQGKPVLISFMFKHDLTRLKAAFPNIKSIDGTTAGIEAESLIQAWNKDALHILAVQPKTLSHGINMQMGSGRDIVWMGLPDELEIYLQLNKRIHRQGVKSQVRIHRILTNRTVDVVIRDRIETKDGNQKSLLDSLNEYRKSLANEQA
jgi:SNF2 family DNA or RNA helicase